MLQLSQTQFAALDAIANNHPDQHRMKSNTGHSLYMLGLIIGQNVERPSTRRSNSRSRAKPLSAARSGARSGSCPSS